ncbi:hypothetical protein ACH5RR_031684 [Cinchona calisaya]|uniref:Uncharacterized protein n=1 Tax=Cinchona calisaya TaxID=153742 RepID=A0ABD2YIZ7_9GENT
MEIHCGLDSKIDEIADLTDLANLRVLVGKVAFSATQRVEHRRVDKEAMPRISCLMIWGCRKLQMFPDGLKYALSLEELLIFEMPGEFCDRIEGIDVQVKAFELWMIHKQQKLHFG